MIALALVIGVAIALAGLLVARRRRIRELERRAGMRPGTIADARRAADDVRDNAKGGRT